MTTTHGRSLPARRGTGQQPVPALAVALLLAGCVVVPREAQVYDERCRSYVRQVVLEAEVIGSFGHCHNEGCLAMLAAAGIVTGVSAVVSGSVAIVGNVVHWIERRGQCPAAPAPALPRHAPPPTLPPQAPLPMPPTPA